MAQRGRSPGLERTERSCRPEVATKLDVPIAVVVVVVVVATVASKIKRQRPLDRWPALSVLGGGLVPFGSELDKQLTRANFLFLSLASPATWAARSADSAPISWGSQRPPSDHLGSTRDPLPAAPVSDRPVCLLFIVAILILPAPRLSLAGRPRPLVR